MSNAATNPKVQCFPVEIEKCSVQAQTLYALDQEYQQRVHKLWEDTADNPSRRELQRRGYAYLVSLYYGMPTRAQTDDKPMSMEFNDITFFCRYVGPRPTPKHSLHRMNNDIGYCIGNLEWADKRKQAEVRNGAQHHLYLGRRLTDRALAEHLKSKGRKTTAGAIKKIRQRYRSRGIAPTEITRMIFDRHGLPYATSHDPVEAWDFPLDRHEDLTKLYPAFRRQHENRIHFFIRWLEEQIQKLTSLRGDFNTSDAQKFELSKLLWKYRGDKLHARDGLKKLHQHKIDKLLAESAPPMASPQKVIPLYKTPMTVMPPPESHPAPENKVTKTDNKSAWVAYKKLVGSRIKLPEDHTYEEFLAALHACWAELAAEGIFPPGKG